MRRLVIPCKRVALCFRAKSLKIQIALTTITLKLSEMRPTLQNIVDHRSLTARMPLHVQTCRIPIVSHTIVKETFVHKCGIVDYGYTRI